MVENLIQEIEDEIDLFITRFPGSSSFLLAERIRGITDRHKKQLNQQRQALRNLTKFSEEMESGE